MPHARLYSGGLLAVIAATVLAAIVAIYAYLTPLTGVTGTIGALIAAGAAILLLLAALLLPLIKPRWLRITLALLMVLGLLGTGFAGLLLHQWVIPAAMAVGLLGLLIDLALGGRTSQKQETAK